MIGIKSIPTVALLLAPEPGAGGRVLAVALSALEIRLRLFERDGLLSPQAADNMRAWRHGGGFSVDASAAVEADDRAGLESASAARRTTNPTLRILLLRVAAGRYGTKGCLQAWKARKST